ncbi:hypothetical protein HETIRDRAFT_455065 [Heterobasidion irregulare TC 32-1]|uniref:FAD/NAD(P)-binding domain-containing protein n=1 Tax=Heterobasidion irregulare (strain TC 32-1) TaxID=747525 RepID=W4JUG8_HETIT|nr:uncharacterized protein HETIRDRAFT_455065 [Heterobasidion irregulare TC 32-1]ETW76526.1 hypothetical protein HETIRDRAFT_455065 [Heterobasidion irregulare TC 32-1]
MTSTSPTSKPTLNIVIIGGSYVGCKAAELIAQRLQPYKRTHANTHIPHRILLIEQNSHFQHRFAFPRCAVVPGDELGLTDAIGAANGAETRKIGLEQFAFIPYTRMFAALESPDTSSSDANVTADTSVTVVHARATSILPSSIVLDPSSSPDDAPATPTTIPYDFLVLATGTQLTPPGVPPATNHGGTTKREGVAYYRAHQERVRSAESIVIVGGGAVGVQLATDLKEHYPNKHITLIHSRARLMHTFHPKLHAIIMQRVNDLGIDVVLEDRVIVPEGGFPGAVQLGADDHDSKPFEVALRSGRAISNVDFVILATGQTPQPVPISVSCHSDPESSTPTPIAIPASGYIPVLRTFQLAQPADSTRVAHPHIFAIGDAAATPHQKAARPGFAHAEIVSRNIEALILANANPSLDQSKSGDLKLEEYGELPGGIHLSLGKRHNVRFRESEEPGGEPWYKLSEDGAADMRVRKLWEARAPGIVDYTL